MRHFYPLLALLMLLAICTSEAQNQKGYHLFKPAPRDQMREFSIDRPDVTESAITVDAGHFQFEGDLVKWTKQSQGKSPRTISFVNALYKMGLNHNWDIHIGLELHNIYQDAEGNKLDDGYGATTIRLKRNFWGNDGETRTALGMIPYVTFVSGDPFNSDVIYGVGFPFAYTLNENLDLGGQPQFDFVLDENGKHELSYFQTVVLGGALIGKLDFYLEGLIVIPPDDTQFLTNGGLIYNINDNVKVDVAGNIGLNNPAPTRVYLGLSFRI
jgi:hypothetical protein